MMHVLYLSYFSPFHLHAASNRSQRFAQYLSQAGCHVDLLCEPRNSQWPQQPYFSSWQPDTAITHQMVASWDIDWLWRWPALCQTTLRHMNLGQNMGARLFPSQISSEESDIAKMFLLVDKHWGWVIPSLWQCCQHIMANRPDVILVSCPPFSSSLIGYFLSRWFGLPLVLDFRDAWSRASYFSEGRISPWEKRVLRQAAKLIVTSQSDWLAYQRLIGQGKVAWIPNSYDYIPEPVFRHSEVFTLGYSGSWSGFRCSAEGIFSQLTNVPFTFRFINIGEHVPVFDGWVKQYGLKHVVKTIGQLEKKQAQSLLCQCDALFIQKGSPDRGKTDTHLATKAIDYVACGRPILAELPEGETLEFLRQYAGRLYEVGTDSPGEYYQQLTTMHWDWQQQPERQYRPSTEFFEAFDATALGERLYQELTEIAGFK
ncbi:hypothetical protein MD588_06145 [Photobacterium sp. SDRW27]|uniref:glycosyltransferase n=1 Tax=Photobacterium obscurum TaxID=2829490 RepID=UPI002243B4C0|nr:glycosyltransferase [Photobacterium obscurum]MCW8328385.1 hypothetical protein [Photobacterium obscurum]